MKFKRIFLRQHLGLQKNLIKLKSLTLVDFYKTFLVMSGKFARIIHLKNLVLYSVIFSVAVSLLFLSSFNALGAYYLKDKPKSGGVYAEGSLGKFYRINPLYSGTNPNDEDAVNLIFSGLMKRGDERSLKPDLADKWSVSEDGKVYVFELKKNIKWQDGESLTADDVLFTIQSIQNPDTRSPLYETWKGVRVEKSSDNKIQFILSSPLDSFLENTTVKIIPKHLLEKIPAASIQTAEFNVKPVGSGPYELESLTKGTSKEILKLKRNEDYYGKKPFIDKVRLEGYQDAKEMKDDYDKRNLNGLNSPSFELMQRLEKSKDTILHEYILPSYVALFFNTEKEFVKDKNLRTALGLAVNRKEILEKAVQNKGVLAYYPLTPGLNGYLSKGIAVNRDADVKKAGEVLVANGYTFDKDRLKHDAKEVKLKLVTGDSHELKAAGEVVKKEFEKLGVGVEVISASASSLQKDYIRPRNYDVLIIGENLGASLDLFSFWHSSEVNDPGLNFSQFKSRKLDKFIEVSRKMTNLAEKSLRLDEAQKVILEEAPAVYLYNPFYYFVTTDKVKGMKEGKAVSPVDRFENIEEWYLKADRVMVDSK